MIIIGVLAAVALPNLLGQIGKARETELKNSVGTINRSQKSYHFELQTFASNINLLGITVPSEYNTDTTMGISATSTWATALTKNTNFSNDGTRAYAVGILYSNSTYAQILCQSNEVTDMIMISSIDCGTDTSKIR